VPSRRYVREERGIEIEIGMSRSAPLRKMFDAKAGRRRSRLAVCWTPPPLLAAPAFFARFWAAPRPSPGPIEQHIESTVRWLSQCTLGRKRRTTTSDPIENHAGDMQANELKR